MNKNKTSFNFFIAIMAFILNLNSAPEIKKARKINV